eukprot:XP_001694595.1 predicted protein [Chlamydomonas reinhardtii]
MSPPSWGQMPPLQSTSKFLNIFQYCRFLRILGHVMVLLVLALVGLTYTAVVPFTYGPKLLSGNALVVLGSAAVILLFSAVVSWGQCVMCVWSYLAAVTADPGRVPQGWHPFADEQQARAELERMSYSNYYFDRRDPRRPRFCKRCQAWKPERAHHCSVTGRCVLKMDHWCIWVVNCVGLMNYKFFLLFIFYAALGCALAVLLLLGSVIAFFNNKLKGRPAGVCGVSDLVRLQPQPGGVPGHARAAAGRQLHHHRDVREGPPAPLALQQGLQAQLRGDIRAQVRRGAGGRAWGSGGGGRYQPKFNRTHGKRARRRTWGAGL